MKTNLHLVGFETPDHLLLPGLLYEPEKKTDKVVIYLHGNGSSSVFYSNHKMNLFGQELNRIGVSFFPFNNRGAHWIKKLDRKIGKNEESVPYGMTYELIKECILDIDGAIKFLKTLGYKTFYLAGSSTGANKIVVYHYYRRRNPVTKYILIGGGDDVSIYFNFYFKKNIKLFIQTLKECKEKIKQGLGKELVPQDLIPDPLISYQSLYDTINPDGDYNIFPFDDYLHNLKLAKKPLFREYKTIDKPTLVIYGEVDEHSPAPVADCVNALKKETLEMQRKKNIFTYKIIKGADHRLTGKELELIKAIVAWLKL